MYIYFIYIHTELYIYVIKCVFDMGIYILLWILSHNSIWHRDFLAGQGQAQQAPCQ